MPPHSGYSEEEIEKTTPEFSKFLNQIPQKSTTTIMGADINASIGPSTTSDHSIQEKKTTTLNLPKIPSQNYLDPMVPPIEIKMERGSSI
jgi:hypothetical protein